MFTVKKEIHSKVAAGVLTLIIITLLVTISPVGALNLKLNGSKGPHKANEVVNFTASVDLESQEKVAFQNFSLVLDAEKKKEEVICTFDINGTVISGCQGIDIDLVSSNVTFGYGYAEGSGSLEYLIKINLSQSTLSLGNNKIYLLAETDTGQIISQRQDLVMIPAKPVK